MIKILSNTLWLALFVYFALTLQTPRVHSLGGWNFTDYDVSLVRACDHIILWLAGHSRNTAGERSHGETGSQEPWRSHLCSLVTAPAWELGGGFQERYLNLPKGDEPPPMFYVLCPIIRGSHFLKTPPLKGFTFSKAPPSDGPLASITTILDTKPTRGPPRTNHLQPARLMAPPPSPDKLSLIFKPTASSSVASASLCQSEALWGRYHVPLSQRSVRSCAVVWLWSLSSSWTENRSGTPSFPLATEKKNGLATYDRKQACQFEKWNQQIHLLGSQLLALQWRTI